MRTFGDGAQGWEPRMCRGSLGTLLVGDWNPVGSASGIRTGLGVLSTLLEPRTVGSRRSTSPEHGK